MHDDRDKRDFTTLPRRALADQRLSGVDLRVLGAISLYDGRSMVLGSGQGCWAGDRKLAQTANTDRTNVKRATARLFKCGYLVRDTDTSNRRGFVIRVIPDSMANGIGGEVTPSQQGAGSPPIGGEVTPSTGGEVTPRIETQENLQENHKIDSAEAAQRDFVAPRADDVLIEIDQWLPGRKDRAEAGLCSGEPRSLRKLLPHNWDDVSADVSPEVRLAQFERAWKRHGRDPNALAPHERGYFEAWLFACADAYHGEQCGYHAQRLLEQLEAA